MDFKNYTDIFLKQFKKPQDTKVYILGFSFGAIVGFLTESKTRPDALILCSLSPYFQQDLKTMRPLWQKWWKKTFINNNFNFTLFAAKIKSKTYLTVGSKEPIEVLRRGRGAKRKIKNSELIIINIAKHNLNQKEYLKAVKELISRL